MWNVLTINLTDLAYNRNVCNRKVVLSSWLNFKHIYFLSYYSFVTYYVNMVSSV